MTVQRRERPVVPPPSGDPAHGWGMDHLQAWRDEQRYLARAMVEEAQEDAAEALAAGARLVRARFERDRAVLALAALEAPTVEMAPVAPRAPTPEPETPPLERAHDIYLRALAEGTELSAAEVNRRIGTSPSFIRRKEHLIPWRERWEAQHRH